MLQRIKLQMARFSIQNQSFSSGVNHQTGKDIAVCKRSDNIKILQIFTFKLCMITDPLGFVIPFTRPWITADASRFRWIIIISVGKKKNKKNPINKSELQGQKKSTEFMSF